MNAVLSFLKRPAALAAVVVLVLVGGGLTWWFSGDDDSTAVLAPGGSSSTSPEPSASTSPEPTPTDDDTECEGPTTRVNLEGEEQLSLLPDCGEPPVTATQQKAKGLGLGCGGSYPTILYKSTADDIKTSVCGKTPSGESFRIVVRTADGAVHDLAGSYAWQQDAFVAKEGDTRYTIQAGNGSIVVSNPSGTTTHESNEWSSLDNESDYD